MKYIRIFLSLAIIGLAIYKRIWIAIPIGLFTLYTAMTGSCGLGIPFRKKNKYVFNLDNMDNPSPGTKNAEKN